VKGLGRVEMGFRLAALASVRGSIKDLVLTSKVNLICTRGNLGSKGFGALCGSVKSGNRARNAPLSTAKNTMARVISTTNLAHRDP
jgi:hypothetical protein